MPRFELPRDGETVPGTWFVGETERLGGIWISKGTADESEARTIVDALNYMAEAGPPPRAVPPRAVPPEGYTPVDSSGVRLERAYEVAQANLAAERVYGSTLDSGLRSL